MSCSLRVYCRQLWWYQVASPSDLFVCGIVILILLSPRSGEVRMRTRKYLDSPLNSCIIAAPARVVLFMCYSNFAPDALWISKCSR